jgi:hypothetical protein
MQPGGASLCKSIQISPNSSKEICFYFLGFVWTSLAESGFFNELRGKKLKKLRFYRRLYLGDSSRLRATSVIARLLWHPLTLTRARSATQFAIAGNDSGDFCFTQHNAMQTTPPYNPYKCPPIDPYNQDNATLG